MINQTLFVLKISKGFKGTMYLRLSKVSKKVHKDLRLRKFTRVKSTIFKD